MAERWDVTVVIPAKNRAHMVGRAVDSIMAQTVAPRRVLVVDDGSSDGTGEVAERHGAHVIRIDQSGGSGPARNRGVEAAESSWVAFLDSDDFWHPGHLAGLRAHAAGHVLLAAPARQGDRVIGNVRGRTMHLSPASLLDPGNPIVTSGAAVRKDALVAAGLFRALPRAQDLDLWLRVLEQGSGIALAEPTVTYSVHDQQVSKDKSLTRACFDQILDDCEARPWFRAGDRDRAYARWRWDEFRAASRGRDVAKTFSSARWFLVRPSVWPALGRVLAERRLGRRFAK